MRSQMNSAKLLESNRMMTKSHNNTPQLRFPEFSGEWKGNTLAEISFLITKGTTPTSVGYKFQKKGVNFIKVENISKNSTVNIRSTPKISNECNLSLKRSILKKHDILFTIAGTLGRTAIIQEKDLPANTNQAVAIIRLNSDQNVKFINLLLNSTKIKKRIYQLLSIGAQPNLSLEQVGSFMLDYPSATEQQKIAVFLSTVEGWIENLKQQKKALEQYKKGMMQKIFSQEIRFKPARQSPDGSSRMAGGDDNGNNFPEWEETRLDELLDYEQPTNYIVSDTEYDDDYKTPVLTAGKSFVLGYTNETDGIFKANLPVIIFDDFTTTSQFVNFPFKVKSSALKILKAKPGIDIGFTFAAMQQIKYKIGGHGRHWISKYSKLKVMKPSSEEQQKIAEFLSGIDVLIDSKKQCISHAEQWKQGLLQKMFV